VPDSFDDSHDSHDSEAPGAAAADAADAASGDRPEPGTEENLARAERAQLCDLFEVVGPDAPTMCAGWNTHHLAAHLVIREGSPVTSISTLVRGRGDERLAETVAGTAFDSLVATIRSGPPTFSFFGTRLTDRIGNSVEYFVHHEDVRRARARFTARELPDWAEDQIWKSLGLLSKALIRKAPMGVALRRSDTGALRVASRGDRTVVIEGLPSELTLFCFGRGQVAEVSFDGREADVEALQNVEFSA
jgi:uncharacterized protein (TIGR03085 family)